MTTTPQFPDPDWYRPIRNLVRQINQQMLPSVAAGSQISDHASQLVAEAMKSYKPTEQYQSAVAQALGSSGVREHLESATRIAMQITNVSDTVSAALRSPAMQELMESTSRQYREFAARAFTVPTDALPDVSHLTSFASRIAESIYQGNISEEVLEEAEEYTDQEAPMFSTVLMENAAKAPEDFREIAENVFGPAWKVVYFVLGFLIACHVLGVFESESIEEAGRIFIGEILLVTSHEMMQSPKSRPAEKDK